MASLIIILLGMRVTASIFGIVFLALILGISVTPLTGTQMAQFAVVGTGGPRTASLFRNLV